MPWVPVPIFTPPPPGSIVKSSAEVSVFPTRFRVLLTDVVPVVAPTLSVVASPPIFKVVAVVLRRLKLAEVVVKLPPFAAILPAKFASSLKLLRTFTPKDTFVKEVAAKTFDISSFTNASFNFSISPN